MSLLWWALALTFVGQGFFALYCLVRLVDWAIGGDDLGEDVGGG